MTNLAQDFDKIISKISDHLQKDGVEKATFASVRQIEKLPNDIQMAAIKRVRLQLEQMELLRPEIQEHERLKILCDHHRLKPVDESIYNKLSKDTAWEIIDFQVNQIYRSKIVFKLGNYSIEEYETNSPWDLFLRPQIVLESLMKLTQKLKITDKIMSVDIKPYIIQEALSEQNAQYKISHEYACPLMDVDTGVNKAFISTFKVEPVAEKVVLFN